MIESNNLHNEGNSTYLNEVIEIGRKDADEIYI